MKCPKCKHNMRQVAFGDVLVDRCRKCFGLWLDDSELDSLRKLQDSEAIDLSAPEGAEIGEPDHALRCPRCRCRLDTKRRAVEYESCHQCGGLFLDAGEFSKDKSATIGQKIKGFFGFGK